MNNKKYIVLMIVLVAVGSMYAVSSNPNNTDFCVWGLTCGDIINLEKFQYYEFIDYNFTEEGIVSAATISIYDKEYSEDNFLKALEEVVNVSRRDYQEVIEVASLGEDFNDIYHLNLKIFNKRYTLLLDDASPTGEYIQNIGEIVLNGYKGDCDDYALMLYLIAREKGLDTRYAIGKSISYGHAWIEIKIDGEWIEYDSTSDRICDDCVSASYAVINYFEEGDLKEGNMEGNEE